MIYQNNKFEWCRRCPTCNKELIYIGYNSKAATKFYDKLHKECRSCCRKGKKCYIFGKKHSEETKKKIGISNFGKHRTENHKRKYSECQLGEKAFWFGKRFSLETKRKISMSLKGRKLSRQTKQKLSHKKMGKNNPMYDKIPTEKHREKMRIAALKRLERQGILPSYNLKACQFIDEYGKQNGYNFQHALNGGEVKICGYSLDGYDKEKNVIFEYDEKHHRYKKFSKKDLIRQKNIINKLNPKKFIRYDEWNDTLYDILTDKNLLNKH